MTQDIGKFTVVTGPPDGFGFKRLTPENWLTVDPVWAHFPDPAFRDQAAGWAEDVLKHDLPEEVPLALRKQFEVARGALLYGFMFYPLLTLGTEQLFRVLDAAIAEKCQTLGAPARADTFAKKLAWMLETGGVNERQHWRWDAVRGLRNRSSHARDQSLFDPSMALDMLRCTVELAAELFGSAEART
jgi:hypothetical protein